MFDNFKKKKKDEKIEAKKARYYRHRDLEQRMIRDMRHRAENENGNRDRTR